MRLFSTLAGVVLFTALVAQARPVEACGGAIFDDETAALHRAQRALDNGDYEMARSLARTAEATAANEAIAARARRVTTMGWVRDVDAPENELRQAMGRLAIVRNNKPEHDVQSASDLGEALARFP